MMSPLSWCHPVPFSMGVLSFLGLLMFPACCGSVAQFLCCFKREYSRPVTSLCHSRGSSCHPCLDSTLSWNVYNVLDGFGPCPAHHTSPSSFPYHPLPPASCCIDFSTKPPKLRMRRENIVYLKHDYVRFFLVLMTAS